MKRHLRIIVFSGSLTLSFVLAATLVLAAFALIDRQVNPPELIGPGYVDYGLGMLMLFVGAPMLFIMTIAFTWFINSRFKALVERWLAPSTARE